MAPKSPDCGRFRSEGFRSRRPRKSARWLERNGGGKMVQGRGWMAWFRRQEKRRLRAARLVSALDRVNTGITRMMFPRGQELKMFREVRVTGRELAERFWIR